MNTYLVMFDCLVVAEPYFQHIQANSLDDCWRQAYEISRSRHELSEGNFEIYKLMTEQNGLTGFADYFKSAASAVQSKFHLQLDTCIQLVYRNLHHCPLQPVHCNDLQLPSKFQLQHPSE